MKKLKICLSLLLIMGLAGCSSSKNATPREVFDLMKAVNSSEQLRSRYKSLTVYSLNEDLNTYTYYDDQTALYYVEEYGDMVTEAYIERNEFRYSLENSSFSESIYLNSEDMTDIWQQIGEVPAGLDVTDVTYTDIFTILSARLGKDSVQAYLQDKGLQLNDADHLEVTFMLEKESNTLVNRKEELFYGNGNSEIVLEEEYLYDQSIPDNDYLQQLDDHFKEVEYGRSLQIIFDANTSNEKQMTYRVPSGDGLFLILSGRQVTDEHASSVDNASHNNDMVYYIYSDGQIPKAEAAQGGNDVSDDKKVDGFVSLSEYIPDAILEIRYYSTYNFVGERINGYEQPIAILSKEAAQALKEVSDELAAQGYRLKIYDAYRPQRAVDHFVRWSKSSDTKMKAYFYPELEKDQLFPQGYIMEKSGHSRGSTVDLTLFDMASGKEVDMGGTFDYFGELSHPDYDQLSDEQKENRQLLAQVMTSHGFQSLPEEWWHFTLENEPYPDTYFDFPVNADYLK